ncbi:putative L-cysteine desulfhydrase 1 [Curcuma longa]|uniref:putative L-cysteine desulfhydrase 1 n=1 Tax=Curcuma longa TaxID=136217 RepID=UPI003D9F69F1
MNPPRHRDENVTGASRLPAKPPQTASTPITAAEVAEEFSHHHPSVARLNNGSFGSCPASVSAAQLRWQQLFLRQPDEFYFHHLKPGILRSRALVRDLVNAADIEEISLVDNATTAVAIVLQHASCAFRKGDAVVILHYAYPAVKKSIHAYIIARSGGHVIEVPLPFPISSDEEIIREFRNALDQAEAEGRRVRLAVICHVTSMPSVVVPVKQLTRICREAGVDQVFVDGAHSVGNVEVDVQDIGADFYTSNLHKWFFCPPSVAFLYARKASTSPPPALHHPVVSHEYGNGLPTESSWIGTRDYSPQLVVPSAMEFISRFEGGIQGIQKRNHESVVKMGEMLAAAWETLLGSPPGMCSSMIMVGLPSGLGVSSEADALNLRSLLREEFEVEVPVHFHPLAGGRNGVAGFVRISHQVYNVEDDYYRLRDAVLQLVRDGITCSMIPTA